MSSATSNNDEPNRGGRGGRGPGGRGRGRGGGGGKKSGGGGGGGGGGGSGGGKKSSANAAGGSPAAGARKKKLAGRNPAVEWGAHFNVDYRAWLLGVGMVANAAEYYKRDYDGREKLWTKYQAHLLKQEDIEQKKLETKLLHSKLDLEEITKMNTIAWLNPYDTISDSHYSSDDSTSTKVRSIAYYGLPDENYCQILGPQPAGHVKIVNAHIWPRHATSDLTYFGLSTSDIHTARNVLRLHQCIERAFDHRKVAFVEDVVGDEGAVGLVLKVLSPELLVTELKGTTTKFSDIDGKPLLILNTAEEVRPFRRLLANHSVCAHRYARKEGWISEDLEPVEVNAAALMEHSLDSKAQERLKMMWENSKET